MLSICGPAHYNQAVSILVTTIGATKQQSQTVLTYCLIFVWIESIRDNLNTALTHLQSGKILSEQGDNIQLEDSGSIFQLTQVFIRVHVQAMLHCRPTSDFDSIAVVPMVYYTSGLGTCIPARFHNVLDARAALDAELLCIYHFHRQIEKTHYQKNPDPNFITTSIDRHITRLQAWMHPFQYLVSDPAIASAPDVPLHNVILQIELQYHFALNTLQTLNPSTPKIYDAHNDVYALMVDLCQQLLDADVAQSKAHLQSPTPTAFALPFDTSLLGPLFYVVLKCRKYTTRHRALDLIRLCSVYEGAWSKNSVFEFAK